uniref:hypothetical protein n=1 Tax=Salmonella enterica TaxID=28901 RepID=UPI0020C1CCF4
IKAQSRPDGGVPWPRNYNPAMEDSRCIYHLMSNWALVPEGKYCRNEARIKYGLIAALVRRFLC